jgi:Dolichyl-phosphate-mannose-protein mannosyltransferase
MSEATPTSPTTSATPVARRAVRRNDRAAFGPLPRWAVLALVAAGLALRAWALSTRLGVANSDDSIVGLMAIRHLRGEFYIYYWGQRYGGSFEPYLTALFFSFLPRNGWTLRLAPVVLHGVSAVLLARIAVRFVNRPVASFAGLLWWVAPPLGILWSIHAGGYYGVLVAAGLGTILLTLRLTEAPTRRDALVLGLVASIGVWASPQYVLLAAAPVVVMTVRRPQVVRAAAWSLVVAVPLLGPWVAYQLKYDWAGVTPPDNPNPLSYLDRVGVFFRGVPMLFGFQVPNAGAWSFWGAPFAFAAVVVACLAGCAASLRGQGWRVGWMIATIGVLPFAFAISPLASEPHIIRYFYPVAPLAILFVVVGLRSGRAVVAVSLLAIASAVVGIQQAERHAVARAGCIYELVPPDLEPLIEELDRRDATHVWAEYFTAFRLTFATEERIIAAPTDILRFNGYNDAVWKKRPGVYVYPAVERFPIEQFVAADVAFDSTTVGDFTIYELHERDPGPRDLGLQQPVHARPACF